MDVKVTNYRAIIKILGTITLIIGAAEIIPWLYAEVTNDTAAAFAFRICTPATILLGAGIQYFLKTGRSRFGAREGYLVVASCWVLASIAM